jgi:hypothetical protein
LPNERKERVQREGREGREGKGGKGREQGGKGGRMPQAGGGWHSAVRAIFRKGNRAQHT